VPRIALTPAEAAAAVGVSRAFFYEHVLPDLRVIRKGRCRLIPVAELQAWCDARAERAG
jgi:excisionase family DNA binding protein